MNDTFLKTCRGEKTSYTPVWIMRQAGRFLPQYRALQTKYDFLTMCRTPELAAQATVLPVGILGVDAAIFFSDILTTVEPMGLPLTYVENRGPVFVNPVRTRTDVDRLIIPDPEDKLAFVPAAVKIAVKELKDKVPVIGFAGAPYTMAAFMVEGGGGTRYVIAKRMMFEQPAVFHTLLEKVSRLTTAYLKSQIKAGAHCVMLFDTCGVTLGPRDYAEFNLPYVKQIVDGLKSDGAPVIYYVTGSASFAEKAKESGADVIGVDWRLDLDIAARRMGKDVTLQGNLEPFALYMARDRMEERVKDVLSKGAAARAHIFNLGDGILPDAPVDNVIAMVEAVHRFSKRK